MGKLVLAFLFYIASAALAVHEARAPARPPRAPVVAPRADRVNVPETADPVRFTRPFYIRPLPPPAPPTPATIAIAPPQVTVAPVVIEVDSEGDIPDNADRCPSERDVRTISDDDGCPFDGEAVIERAPRTVRLDIID